MLDRLRRKNDDKSSTSPAGGEVFLIVGLGNPGRRYQATRHNMGFMVVDRIYDRLPPGTARSRFQADFVETSRGGRRVVLVKPQTFMNDSGVAVGQLARWYKAPLENILLVYDELDLPLGTIRLRPGGSDGGHNGVASVIAHLKSQEIPRLRVGIGRPRAGATVPYVLSRFFEDERKQVPEIIDRAADAAIAWVEQGVASAMNVHNRRSAASSESATTGF